MRISQRRVPALQTGSRGDLVTARWLNRPIDAINAMAAGVEPPRQRAFYGRTVKPAVTGPWLCTRDINFPINQVIVELDAATMRFKLGRLIVGYGWTPEGIGGDSQVIWQLEKAFDRIRKFDPVTMAMIEDGGYPFGAVEDLGGSVNALWVLVGTTVFRLDVELDANRRYPILETFTLPGAVAPVGVGGDETYFYYVDGATRWIGQVKVSSGGLVGSWIAPPHDPPSGDVYKPASIGGNANAVYYATRLIETDDPGIDPASDKVYRIYHLDPNNDLAIVAEAKYQGLEITGIGG